MKKKYVRPIIAGERFLADEYIAACGESGVQYIFQCNAPAGTLYYYKNGETVKVGSFHPNTSVVHYADSDEEFLDGFIDYNQNGTEDNGEKVIVWVEYSKGWFGSYHTDYHATTDLNKNEGETSKS